MDHFTFILLHSYWPSFYCFLYFFILVVTNNNKTVLAIQNVSTNRQKSQEIIHLDRDYTSDRQPCRQDFDSNRANEQYTSSNGYGSTNGGGGVVAWQGKCPHCYQEYANISSLKYHVRLVHSEANNTICCYLCPQNFSSKLVMREHLSTCHNVKYQWGPIYRWFEYVASAHLLFWIFWIFWNVLDISFWRMMHLMDEMVMPQMMTKFSERMPSQTSTKGCYFHTKIDISRQVFINKMMW